VKPADAFVVELNRIIFFATNGDGRRQVAKHAPALEALQDLNRNFGHPATTLQTTAEVQSQSLPLF
jgi:hypothetical protein